MLYVYIDQPRVLFPWFFGVLCRWRITSLDLYSVLATCVTVHMNLEENGTVSGNRMAIGILGWVGE